MLNSTNIVGRLTDDPDLRYLDDGTAVVNFTIAVNRNYDRDKTDFIDCVAWRKTAEFAADYLRKGNITAVDGKLQTRTYEDQQGNNRKQTEIRCDNIQPIEWPNDDEQQSNDNQQESVEVPF